MASRTGRRTAVRLILALASAVGPFFLWSCGADNPVAPGGVPQAVRIEVSPSAALLWAVGASVPFTAVAVDANGKPMSEVSLGWSSAKPAVAAVDDLGRVTAAGDGTTTITVAGAGLTASAEVVVSAEVTNVARVTARDQPDPDGTNGGSEAVFIVTLD